MERWSGVLRVFLDSNNKTHFNVTASLCLSHFTYTLAAPCSNAIFFCGDLVQGTRNPVIERLSDPRNIAEILVSKLGVSINAWVVQASVFNGPFAVYREFVPSMNAMGEPRSYDPTSFPASNSTVLLISKCLEEAKKLICAEQKLSLVKAPVAPSVSCPSRAKTIIIGFSKGGTVLNQLVAEFSHVKIENVGVCGDYHIFPTSKESLLNSISDFHYVDVGLNTAGAYLTDDFVIMKLSERLSLCPDRIRFVLHGTPRQWCDSSRRWIRNEKDRLLKLLEGEAYKCGGKLEVCEKFYFADRRPNLQIHFEIIESMDMS